MHAQLNWACMCTGRTGGLALGFGGVWPPLDIISLLFILLWSGEPLAHVTLEMSNTWLFFIPWINILDTLFFCLSFWLVKFSFHILVYYILFSLPVSHSLYLCMIYLFHSFTKVPYSFFWTKILKDQKSWSKLHEDLQGLCVKIHWSFNLSCRWHFLI